MSIRLDAVLWDRENNGLENSEHTPTSATRNVLRSGSLGVHVWPRLKQINEHCETPTIENLPQGALPPLGWKDVDKQQLASYDDIRNLDAFVSVSVHGSKDLTRVALPTRFRKTIDPTTPTSAGSFYKYMSERLKVNVTAVYYPVRRDDAVHGGQGSCALKKFIEDAGPTRYPFVGGMRLVLCLNGDELQDDELLSQTGAPCQGAGCCLM